MEQRLWSTMFGIGILGISRLLRDNTTLTGNLNI